MLIKAIRLLVLVMSLGEYISERSFKVIADLDSNLEWIDQLNLTTPAAKPWAPEISGEKDSLNTFMILV